MNRPSWLRRHRLALVGGALVLGSCVAVAGTVVHLRRQAPVTAYRLYLAGQDAVAAKDSVRAQERFVEAARIAPHEPKYLLAAAQAAALGGRKPEARLYARRAWEQGLRSPEVLRLLVLRLDTEDQAQALAAAQTLIASLPAGAGRLDLEITALDEAGKVEDALAACARLLQVRRDTVTVERHAELLARLNRAEEVCAALDAARVTPGLSADGYDLLVTARTMANLRLQARSDQVDTLPILAEAQARGRWDLRLDYQRAVQQYLRLQVSAVIDGLIPLVATATGSAADQDWRHRSRLLLALAYGETGRTAAIAGLAKLPPATGARREGEALVYRALASATMPAREQVQLLQKAERLLGPDGALQIALARCEAQAGEPALAIKLLGEVNGPLAFSPQVLIDQAAMLASIERRDEALARVLLCHRLHGVTKRSLLLLGVLTSGSTDVVLTRGVQEAFAEAGRQDPQLLQAGVRYALARGDYQRASELEAAWQRLAASDGSASPLGEAGRRLAAGDHAGALTLLDTMDAPAGLKAAARALALNGLGRHSEALSQLAALEHEAHGPAVDLVLADTAIAAGDHLRATAALARLEESLPHDPLVADLHARLALATNQPQLALAAAERALALTAHPERHLLRASALAQLGRLDDALAACASSGAEGGMAARRLRGEILAAQGNWSAGADDLAAAAAAAPTDLDLGRLAVTARLRAGDGAQAARMAQALALAHPNDVEVGLLTVRVLALASQDSAARTALAALPATVSSASRALVTASVARLGGDRPAALAALAGARTAPTVAVAWALEALAQGDATAIAPVLAPFDLPINDLVAVATAAERAGRHDEAAALMTLGLKHAPDDPVLLNNWAWYQSQVPGHDAVAVRAMAQRAWKLAPGSAAILETFADILLRQDRAAECAAALAAAPETRDGSASLLWLQGRAWQNVGRTAEAREALRKAQRLASAAAHWPLGESAAALVERLAQLGG